MKRESIASKDGHTDVSEVLKVLSLALLFFCWSSKQLELDTASFQGFAVEGEKSKITTFDSTMNHLQRSTHSQPFEEVPCGIAKLANSQHHTSALFASTRAAIASFFSFRQRLERFFKNAREKALRHSETLRRLRLTV